MKTEVLKNYAKLAVTKGINVQKGQPVVIMADVSQQDFVRDITDAAYEAGAGYVTVFWTDEYVTRQNHLNAEEKYFEEYPQWMVERFKYYDDNDAAYINVRSDNPENLKGVDVKRIQKLSKAAGEATKTHRELLMSSGRRWNIVAMPSVEWARKVFPDLDDKAALLALSDAIAKCTRIDCEDPVSAWEKHDESFIKRADYMNEKQFVSLHYKNSAGTDLVVELPEGHKWLGGSENAKDGFRFFANMPTEELFTLPKKSGVNGTLVSTMPLVYSGNLIEDIRMEFKDGKIVSCSASSNEEMFKNLISLDEGASYLGEVALVPFDSPISQLNILFYNTLFDENASCHFALGEAYKSCLESSENMTEEELKQRGVNSSIIHIDFMVGSKDLSIVANGKNGEKVDIFVNGNFALPV